jgi:hypothetical protein
MATTQYLRRNCFLGFDFECQQKNDVAGGGKESKTIHHHT